MSAPLTIRSSVPLALLLVLVTVGPGGRALSDSDLPVVIPPLAQSGLGPGWGRGMGPPSWSGRGRGMGAGMQRHRLARMGNMPESYRGLRNPLAPAPKDIAAGQTLYVTHCASCHGAQGQGDGPAAEALRPPPANLRWVLGRPMASDGYLMWVIAEGGAALGSAMPAFRAALSETDRWQILLFIRAL